MLNNDFIEIRYIIRTAFQSLSINADSLEVPQYPLQPILINIAILIKKGCSLYYKLIRQKKSLKNNIYLKEDKWHQNLNMRFSLWFWSNSWKMVCNLKWENKMKWLQYSILRSCLKTNKIVNKFIPNQYQTRRNTSLNVSL